MNYISDLHDLLTTHCKKQLEGQSMSQNQDEIIEKSAKHQDFITFEPATFKFLSKKDMELVERHKKIIQALRQNKNMTVKEIHRLEDYPYTIKTTYKHLENLENADLVRVSGHRMTQGSRQTEKLYSRTAYIFYPDPNEEELESKIESIRAYSENANIIMSELLEAPKAEKTAFFSFFSQIYELRSQTITEILEKTKTSQYVVDVLTKVDLHKLNKLNESVSILVVFLRHPQLFEQLQKLYKS